jgi:hypothetical protein
LQTGIAAIEAEQFDKPALILAAAKTQEQQIIATANAAQIQADQRDYIAKSIAETLAEMGFFVNEPQLEDSRYPNAALILKAATNSGKGISISIPVEGEVWYNVDGYSKTTEAAVGGGTAAVCDEAEKGIDRNARSPRSRIRNQHERSNLGRKRPQSPTTKSRRTTRQRPTTKPHRKLTKTNQKLTNLSKVVGCVAG